MIFCMAGYTPGADGAAMLFRGFILSRRQPRPLVIEAR